MPYFWLSNNVCLQRSLQRITETTEPAEPQPDLRMELLGRLPAILSGPAVEKLHGCHLYYLCYYRSITSRYEQERFPTPLLLGLPFEKSNDVKETIWKASLPGARTLLGAPGIATNGAFLHFPIGETLVDRVHTLGAGTLSPVAQHIRKRLTAPRC